MQLTALGPGVAGALLLAHTAGAQLVAPTRDRSALPPAPLPAPAAALSVESVDTLVARALAANPAIRAAAARIEAARARVAPAGARPDPMLMAGVQNLPLSRPGFADEMTMAMVGVGQTLPTGGKPALRRRAAAFEVDAARAELDRVRLTVARDVREAYYDLAYLDRALALVARNEQVLVELTRVGEARYASGADLGSTPTGAMAGPSGQTTARPAAIPAAGGGVAPQRMTSGSTAGSSAASGAGMGAMGGTAAPSLRAPAMATGQGAMTGTSMLGASTAGTAMGGGMRAAPMGGGALQEVLRARADVARLAEDAAALVEERRAVLARLNALLDRPSDAPVASPAVPARLTRAAVADSARQVRFASAALGARATGSPLPAVEALEALAAERSPEIRTHEAMIAAQAARVELARRERRPDVDVAVQYGVRPTHPDMVTATVSVPLPVQRRRVQDQLVAAAGGELAALEAEHHQRLAEHRAEIARLHAEAERARTQLALLKAVVLPQAHAALAASVAAYEAGQVGLAAVLDARAGVFNQETAYYRALSDFAKAVAELERSVGVEVLP